MAARAMVVLVTCPTRRVATRLAGTLLEQRLAACVNIVPGIESRFWWQGQVDRAREFLLIIKTRPQAFEPLRRHVLAHHPYEVPEIIALPVTHGHPAYLAWVIQSTRTPRRSRSR